MPAPLARGIIITVTVLVAAGVAAYENPQIRAWIDRTRHKIAMGLHSLGDEVQPSPSQRRRQSANDASMHEEKGEWADERRRQAISEIMERGRIMEERRKRRKLSGQGKIHTTGFDNIVDDNGTLIGGVENGGVEQAASSSAIDPLAQSAGLKQRQKQGHPEAPPLSHHSVAGPQLLRQPTPPPIDEDDAIDQFESRYEREMREAWKIPVSDRHLDIPSSHASESLIDLTPTTEDAPDPDFSVPSAEYVARPSGHPEYFPASAAHSLASLSDHGSHGSMPGGSYRNLPATMPERHDVNNNPSGQSASSVTGSISNIHPSEAEESSDDLLSELDDGMRTPASVWTEVDSTVSGDFNL